VAHTCNLSYSGSRDQEDDGSKPAQVNSSQDPFLEKKKKNPSQKRDGEVAQGVSPKLKFQYCKKERKKFNLNSLDFTKNYL
jgi:hypothetical protein